MVLARGAGPAYAGTAAATPKVSASGPGQAYAGATPTGVPPIDARGAGPSYSGNVTAVARIDARGRGSAYEGVAATATQRVSASAEGPAYDGLVASVVLTKTAAESGEFFTATADQAGAWGAVFPPELAVPTRTVRQAADGLSALVYAPASSSGYTFLVTCGPASASVQVQPTSFDDRRGKPVVFYARGELPLPFDPNALNG